VYKPLVLSILLTVLLSAPLAPLAPASPVSFDLPRLKCYLKQSQFITEIIFSKSESHPTLKGFEGELRNSTLQPNGTKTFISGVAFQSVFYQNPGFVSGIIGDDFGSSGTFTLVRSGKGFNGTWKYSRTNLGGTNDHANFHCVY
jgi:hypothetical protein